MSLNLLAWNPRKGAYISSVKDTAVKSTCARRTQRCGSCGMLSLRQSISRNAQDNALGDRTSSAGAGLKSIGGVLALMAANVTLVLALRPSALAATDFCPGGTLDQGAPLGKTGPDLVITNMICTVDGTKAPYNFHNVTSCKPER